MTVSWPEVITCRNGTRRRPQFSPFATPYLLICAAFWAGVDTILAGRTVLVIETEFIIALAIQSLLESVDAASVLVANSPGEADSMAASWADAALAIVELEADRPDLLDLARRLSEAGIPVLGLSADPQLAASGVPELPGTPVVLKPIPDAELMAAIARRLDQNPLPEVT